MSLANGRQYLAIPGPSVMPDRVLAAMHRAAPNIYAGELIELTQGLVPDLKRMARTVHRVAMYIGNGHAVWEAALNNTLSQGDRVLVLNTGRFADGWASIARGLGVVPEVLDFGLQGTLDHAAIARALEMDKSHAIKAVLMVHVDTSSSVRNDIAALRATLDSVGHPALLMVDCMASLGCERFEMDAWGVDLMVAGCQKGLMTPPGMGFVFFNDKAGEARERAKNVSVYWDWKLRADPDIYSEYFCGTAPTHHLFGLRVALDMILSEEGIESVWARHARLARAIWAACDAWAAKGPLHLNIADPAVRSHAVTALSLGEPNGTALRDWVFENAGVTLGIGLGMAPRGDPAWHSHFRIGHMGHVNAHMVLGVLGAMDGGMKALGVAHGSGALEAASAVISKG